MEMDLITRKSIKKFRPLVEKVKLEAMFAPLISSTIIFVPACISFFFEVWWGREGKGRGAKAKTITKDMGKEASEKKEKKTKSEKMEEKKTKMIEKGNKGLYRYKTIRNLLTY